MPAAAARPERGPASSTVDGRPLLLVGNPASLSGRNAERIEGVRRLLDAAGLPHELQPTLPQGGTVAEVERQLRTGRFRMVVAMGGDGTFHEVGCGLLASGTGVPMGLVPAGTGNNQARSFGLPVDGEDAFARAIAVLAAGATAPLDAGRVHMWGPLDAPLGQDWFFDSMGFGLSATILRLRNADRELVGGVPLLGDFYRDELVYFGAALRTFMATFVEDRLFDAVVRVDGEEAFLEDISDLVINNTRYYARIWVPDPTSAPDDGLMELLAIRGRDEWLTSVVTNLEEVPRDPLEDLPLPKSVIYRGARFAIELRDRPMTGPIESQIDGEEWIAISRLEVEVVPRAIQLVVPADRA